MRKKAEERYSGVCELEYRSCTGSVHFPSPRMKLTIKVKSAAEVNVSLKRDEDE